MAPKELYKVHSLREHITQKDQKTNAKATSKRPSMLKKEPANSSSAAIFDNNDDDGEDSSSNSDSSADEGPSKFLASLPQSRSSVPPSSKRGRGREDEIADSDVERQSSAKKQSSTNGAVLMKKEPASEEDDSSSDSEAEETEAKVKINGAAVAKVGSSTSDSTSDSSSDEESDSDDEVDEEATQSQSKAVADVNSADTSEDESSDESDEEKPAPSGGKSASNGVTAAQTDSSSDEESEEQQPAKTHQALVLKPKNDESVDEEDDDDEDEAMADESIHISDRQNGQQLETPNFIAPDFMLRKSSDGNNGEDVAKICSEAGLQGKQFWYFTVPANIPISVVQNMEIPLDQQGGRAFSHQGQDYGVSFDNMAPKSNIQIMIPSADGPQYRSSPKQLDRVMQIKRITQLGSSSETSGIGPAPMPAARPQPEGLKARFKPVGVYQSPVPLPKVGEDAEMTEAPVMLPQVATSEKSTKKSKKKTKAAAEPASVTEEKKQKKRKITPSEEDTLAADEQVLQESAEASQASKAKKQKTERTGSPELGSEERTTSQSSSSSMEAPPVAPTARPSKVKKSAKKAKAEGSAAGATPIAKLQTPVPLPRQSAVPLPNFPNSSQLRSSPVPVPKSATAPVKETKKSAKNKAKSTNPSNGTSTTHVPPALSREQDLASQLWCES